MLLPITLTQSNIGLLSRKKRERSITKIKMHTEKNNPRQATQQLQSLTCTAIKSSTN